MALSALHRKSSLFDEHNLANDFLLGLASLSLTLPQQLAQPTHQQAESVPPITDGANDDRYLHFLLGVLATCDQFNQFLATEKKTFEDEQTRKANTAVPETAINQLRHLLR